MNSILEVDMGHRNRKYKYVHMEELCAALHIDVPVIAVPAIGVPVVVLLVANVSLLYWLFEARLIVVYIFGVDHTFILVSFSSSPFVVPVVAILVLDVSHRCRYSYCYVSACRHLTWLIVLFDLLF